MVQLELLTYWLPILIVGGATVAAVWLPRRFPAWPWRAVGICLATLLAGCEVSSWITLFTIRPFHWSDDLPLQLCDITVWVAAAALAFRREVLQQLTWFWGIGGGVPALFLPVDGGSFPGWSYFEFYLSHGGLIIAGVLVTVAFGMRVRRSTMFRALVITGALALAIGILDVQAGANYLYLRAVPSVAGPLQQLSSWPLYRVALCSAAALAMLTLGWVARERTCSDLSPAAAPAG